MIYINFPCWHRGLFGTQRRTTRHSEYMCRSHFSGIEMFLASSPISSWTKEGSLKVWFWGGKKVWAASNERQHAMLYLVDLGTLGPCCCFSGSACLVAWLVCRNGPWAPVDLYVSSVYEQALGRQSFARVVSLPSFSMWMNLTVVVDQCLGIMSVVWLYPFQDSRITKVNTTFKLQEQNELSLGNALEASITKPFEKTVQKKLLLQCSWALIVFNWIKKAQCRTTGIQCLGCDISFHERHRISLNGSCHEGLSRLDGEARFISRCLAYLLASHALEWHAEILCRVRVYVRKRIQTVFSTWIQLLMSSLKRHCEVPDTTKKLLWLRSFRNPQVFC